MAIASAGSFAQMDTDPVKLQKRFAEVAADVMNLSVSLDPVYVLTPKASLIRVDIPEQTKTVHIIQITPPNTKAVDLAVIGPNERELKTTTRGVQKFTGQSYCCWQIKTSDADISPQAWTLRLQPDRLLEPKQLAKMHLMILVDSLATIKAEVVGNPAGAKDVTLLCRMLRGNEPVIGCRVSSEWFAPSSAGMTGPVELTLYDDGKHGDGLANDGLYGVKVQLATPGNHGFHFKTETLGSSWYSPASFDPTSKPWLSFQMNSLAPAQKLRNGSVRRETTVYYTANP